MSFIYQIRTKSLFKCDIKITVHIKEKYNFTEKDSNGMLPLENQTAEPCGDYHQLLRNFELSILVL